MSLLLRVEDTICSLATPQGRSALAIIRVSGPNSFSILTKLCPKLSTKFSTIGGPQISYFEMFSPVDGRLIDQVIISFFPKGKSFTGEESLEISCHGNPILVETILEVLQFCGARLAMPGEFSFRAFMNDKIDLVQAESIQTLINSETRRATRLSLSILTGNLSDSISKIEDSLIYLLAHIEAEIDFSEESLDTISMDRHRLVLASNMALIADLLQREVGGKFIYEGFKVAFCGQPNVGKSSLLNLLLQEERAIVTAIPGTTRDVVESRLRWNGELLTFFDTAGIRVTSDEIEVSGMQHGLRKVNESDLVVLTFDAHSGWTEQDQTILDQVSNQCFLIFGNKTDLGVKAKSLEVFSAKGSVSADKILYGSVRNPEFRTEFLDRLLLCLKAKEFDAQFAESRHGKEMEGKSELVVNSRQAQLLRSALLAMETASEGIEKKLSLDLVAADLKQALLAVQEILGKSYDDQILDRVFKEFCLGK